MNDYMSNVSIDELKTGIAINFGKDEFTCILCGKIFQKGIIYPDGDVLMDACKAASTHVKKEHGGMFSSLLSLGKEFTGISDIQKSIVESIFEGRSDKEIAHIQGGKSESTIRNHRFNLKKKKKEAKIFIAVMELLESHMTDENSEAKQICFHNDIPVKDDRIKISKKEEKEILQKYFDKSNAYSLIKFPKKQKIKLVILKKIAELFSIEMKYTELEVNKILMPVYEDYVEIRRYLIDYAFLKRNSDGSIYTLNPQVQTDK